MATLHIVYDPTDKLQPATTDLNPLGLKFAAMPLRDDLSGQDIYAIARRVSELLLEQLR
jgi:hypothetical protein